MFKTIIYSFSWRPVSTIGSAPEAVLSKQFDRIWSPLLDPGSIGDAPLLVRGKANQEISDASRENEAPLEPIKESANYSREY